MKKLILFLLVFSTFGLFGQKTLNGYVTDKSGKPLENVKVSVKYSILSTLTDSTGKFLLKNVPDSATYLIFENSNYEYTEVKITSKYYYRVKLNELVIDDNIDIAYDIEVEESAIIMPQTLYSKSTPYTGINNVNYDNQGTEEFQSIKENTFHDALKEPQSTFSIDVDNASYSNVRRYLDNGQMPPHDAVRIEEMINYFDYQYPEPSGEHPFSIYTEISDAPWDKTHKLIHIGIQGKRLNYNEIKPSNLVFLLDVSGSMSDINKLPLVKKSIKMLVENLSKNDMVSIVVYAGAAGLVLAPTPASDKTKIFEALDRLSAGGSTAGAAGIKLAYETGQKNLLQDGNNRVILCTDGDFNVGVSSDNELVDIITEYRTKYDIYLTICGFGMGNYKDGKLEQISNAGNGNYFYIDNETEAEKVFVKELRANMFTIAKDVKIQVEFNPAEVKEYRLIGYENRVMDNKDFDDDKKDAGELGPGHTVTAIYEIIPADGKGQNSATYKYSDVNINQNAKNSGEIMTLRFRYKPIRKDESILIEQPVYVKDYVTLDKSSDIYRFSASVAAFGMLLRKSEFITKTGFKYDDVISLAKGSMNGKDEYKDEFLLMVEKAKNNDK